MALAQVYTAVTGHVITAARWNNEFGNIYANGTDLAFPLTKAVSLAGYTLTLDAAGATSLTSTASQALALSPGSKSGAPGVNGSFFNVAAATYTDTSTGISGTAALWAGSSFRTPTLAASATGVTTTDAATVYIEGPPTAGTNETFTESSALFLDGKLKVNGDIRLRTSDTRTNTVTAPMTVQAMTSGIPAAGIGVGISFHAESADEAPCVIGRVDFVLSDVSSGSEDSYLSVLTRSAGTSVVNEAWTFSRGSSQFSADLTHTNTADRTYTLPDTNRDLSVMGTVEVLTSGTTWNVPAGVTRVYVELYGASGGGGGGGEGCSGGITAGNDGTSGTAGGTTSFDALTTTGGAAGPGGRGGGKANAGSAGANHGVGSGGLINRTGGGQSGGNGGTGGASSGPAGGPNGCTGGRGGDGGYVEGYLTVTPSGTVTYAIGAAGSAGSGGTGAAGNDGGGGRAGQAGVIVVKY